MQVICVKLSVGKVVVVQGCNSGVCSSGVRVGVCVCVCVRSSDVCVVPVSLVQVCAVDVCVVQCVNQL